MCTIVHFLGQHDVNINNGFLPLQKRCTVILCKGVGNCSETHLNRWATVQFVQQNPVLNIL